MNCWYLFDKNLSIFYFGVVPFSQAHHLRFDFDLAWPDIFYFHPLHKKYSSAQVLYVSLLQVAIINSVYICFCGTKTKLTKLKKVTHLKQENIVIKAEFIVCIVVVRLLYFIKQKSLPGFKFYYELPHKSDTAAE